MDKIRYCIGAFIVMIVFIFSASAASALNLLEVYRQAFNNDAQYQQALAQRKIIEEAIPQTRAALLPQIGIEAVGELSQIQTRARGVLNYYGGVDIDLTQHQRSAHGRLTLTQTLFNWSHWKHLKSAQASVKAAIATYTAETQQLIERVVNAYFAVLESHEILSFTEAEKRALNSEYQRAKQSFKVGLKTMTDVHEAHAAYADAEARRVQAQNEFSNKKEELRIMTNQEEHHLSALKKKFPLTVPQPQDIKHWSHQALQQNWTLQAAYYTTLATHQNIKAAQGGHLPSVDLSAQYTQQHTRIVDEGSLDQNGPIVQVALKLPLYSGGGVSAKAREAVAEYHKAKAQQEHTARQVINDTRQAYLGMMSSIARAKADQEAIRSARSALKGTQEGYKVGIRTIIDVLNDQKSLYAVQKNYASDRYAYIRHKIALKRAAGTLNDHDILTINQWLDYNTHSKN